MQSPAGFKQLERSFRRLRLLVCGCIYEVATPRYALRCFVTHVETWSAPNQKVDYTLLEIGKFIKFNALLNYLIIKTDCSPYEYWLAKHRFLLIN